MNADAARVATAVALPHRSRNAHVTFAASAIVCLLIFGWMVSIGAFRFVAADSFGSFYDHQAAAWLRGTWEVPEPALSSEAFVVEGKVYGYFGPTPALMRLPFVLLGTGFASVTRILMLIDYAACLAAAYALLWIATRWRESTAVPAGPAVVLITVTTGLGSMLFFLGSRAYVYHEAILCGAAFGLWSVVCSLRYLRDPRRVWWVGGLVSGVLAVHARAPIGLFALGVLGSAALIHLFRVRRAGQWAGAIRPGGVVVSSILGIASFNAVSYLKFGTLEGCPLRFNVQYTPDDLARVNHRNFHLSNLRFNSDSYLFRPSFSLNPSFPYIYREFANRKAYPESRIVYRDPTLALPWSMPGLFSQASVGALIAVLVVPAFRLPLAAIWIAALPAALAMLTAISVTQRYTADFCPFLIATSAFAIAAFGDMGRGLRRLTSALSVLLCIAGIGVTFLLTLHHQREIVWGVPEEARQSYRDFRARMDSIYLRRMDVDYVRDDWGS